MRAVCGRYLGVALILLVVLTGQGMAVARGQPGPVGQMELCTGTGPVMVYVDETGTPVGPPHICPDYALSVLLVVDAPDVMPVCADVTHRLPVVRADLQNTELPRPKTVARAPPVRI